MLMPLRRYDTCPSTNEAFMPPVCWLPAARVLSRVSLSGKVAYTNPCDWWWTQANWLHPSDRPDPGGTWPHQLWLRLWAFSTIRQVLLVPSVTWLMWISLLSQPIPVYGPRLPIGRRS